MILPYSASQDLLVLQMVTQPMILPYSPSQDILVTNGFIANDSTIFLSQDLLVTNGYTPNDSTIFPSQDLLLLPMVTHPMILPYSLAKIC